MIAIEIVVVNEGLATTSIDSIGLSISYTDEITKDSFQYILTMTYSAAVIHICPMGETATRLDPVKKVLYVPIKMLLENSQTSSEYVSTLSEILLGYLASVLPDEVLQEIQEFSRTNIETVEYIADGIHYVANMNILELSDEKEYKKNINAMVRTNESFVLCISDIGEPPSDVNAILSHVPFVMAVTRKSVFDREDRSNWLRVYEISTHMAIRRTTDFPPMSITLQLNQMY